MRKQALATVSDLVGIDPRVVFVGSDLGAGTLADRRKLYPDRIMMEGIAEQHLVGFAAGLALEGYVPFVHTIGTFLTRRALEQVIIDVALHRLPVRLLASGGGMTYAPLGPTHQSVDDFALMRAIPGMTVVAPADPIEMDQALRLLLDYPHPAYVRVGKGGEPQVTGMSGEFRIGSARRVRRGERLAFLTTGSQLQECLAAVDSLRSSGQDVSLVHFPTVAPLDEAAVVDLAMEHDVLLVVEEHLPNGGLGTAVAEVVAAMGTATRVVKAALPNRFASNYGSQREHWQAAGLTGATLAAKAAELVANGQEQG